MQSFVSEQSHRFLVDDGRGFVGPIAAEPKKPDRRAAIAQ